MRERRGSTALSHAISKSGFWILGGRKPARPSSAYRRCVSSRILEKRLEILTYRRANYAFLLREIASFHLFILVFSSTFLTIRTWKGIFLQEQRYLYTNMSLFLHSILRWMTTFPASIDKACPLSTRPRCNFYEFRDFSAKRLKRSESHRSRWRWCGVCRKSDYL